MTKLLMVSLDKCIGCRTCETACSLSHEGRINPAEARVTVAKYEDIGVNVPMLCRKCEDPLCMAVCPTRAITMDPLLGTRIDHSRCISCKMCIMVCPVGGVSVNPTSGEVVMCDLCQGDPECVRACPEHALEYMEAGTITYRRRRAGVDKAVRLLAEATS